MGFRREITDTVCEKINCQYLGRRDNGERYCKAYYPECDEYELYEEFLEIQESYRAQLERITYLKSQLRARGILIPISGSKIKKITRED